MKNLLFLLMATCLLVVFLPLQSKATTTPAATTSVSNSKANTEPEELSKALLIRLDKIKNMDKSDLNSSDRKALRKEVRSIKQQLKESGDGIYISVGAAIIILLILILLL